MSPAAPLHFKDGYLIVECPLYHQGRVKIGIGDAIHDDVVPLGRRVGRGGAGW